MTQNRFNNRRMQIEWRKWLLELLQSTAIDLIPVTIKLTKCSRVEAQNTLKRLLTQVNRDVLGSSYRHRNRRLVVVPVLEGREFDNLHYHLLIENPPNWAKAPIDLAIRNAWNKERKARQHFFKNEVPYIEQKDLGYWLNYITKLCSKSNFQDAIDITNLWVTQPTAQKKSYTAQAITF